MRIHIKPHSDSEDALSATDATLSQLPGGGSLVRDASGSYLVEDGWYAVEVRDAGFVTWAAIRQGYVKDVRIDDADIAQPAKGDELELVIEPEAPT